jgi:hypothetical protein
MYRIREVDAHDEEIANALTDLHLLTFFDGASIPEFDWGHWWLAYHEAIPVAFAGVIPSTRAHNAGYFCRVGVLKRHCGHRLQLRLMRAMNHGRDTTGGAALSRIPPTILRPQTILSGLATGCTSPNTHGPGQIPYIGASRSNDSSRRNSRMPPNLFLTLPF